MQGGRGSAGGAMGGSRLMSVRCGEAPWPKLVVNGLPGVEVAVAGKVREMEARVLFNPANLLIPDCLAPTTGMPGIPLFGELPEGTAELLMSPGLSGLDPPGKPWPMTFIY